MMSPQPDRLWRSALRWFWHILRLGWEVVIWGNVRAGSIQLAGAPRSFRALARLGLWASIALLITLIFSDVWRRASPLQPLVFYTDSLSGLFAPRYLVPVALGLLVLAWAYVLCGALHAPWWAALVTLTLFGLFDFSLTFIVLSNALLEINLQASGLPGGFWNVAALLAHVLVWPVAIGFVLVRRFRPMRLGLEFPLCTGLVGALIFSSYFGTQLGLQGFQATEATNALQLTQTLALMGTILAPFLLIAGADMAAFGMTLTQTVTERLRRAAALQAGTGVWLWAAGLAAFLIVRLVSQWIVPLVSGEALPFRWGALVTLAALLGMYALVRWRGAKQAPLPGWVILAAALAFNLVLYAIELVSFASQFVAAAMILSGLGDGQLMADLAGRAFSFLQTWNEVLISAFVAVVSLALWAHARWRRRSLPPASGYGLLFSLWLVWWVFTRSGRALDVLNFNYLDLTALTTVALLLALALAAGLRQLNASALLWLSAAALLLWVLEFQDFLNDPLSPITALLGAQAALLSVSVFLNVMGAGGRFSLNSDSGGFPRFSRSLLYFGYALLTITILNWLAVTHDIGGMRHNDLITQNGFIAIGLPLAFWALLMNSELVLGQNVKRET